MSDCAQIWDGFMWLIQVMDIRAPGTPMLETEEPLQTANPIVLGILDEHHGNYSHSVTLKDSD